MGVRRRLGVHLQHTALLDNLTVPGPGCRHRRSQIAHTTDVV